MDFITWRLQLFLCLQLLALAKSEHENDSAVILTGIPFYYAGFSHFTSITVSPNKLNNYTGDHSGLNLNDNNKLIIACDTDYDNQYLYFYDYNDRSISLLENFNASVDKMSIQESVFQTAASQGFSFLAVDWVNHNVYWTEPMMGRIMLKKGGRNNDTTAHYVVKNDLKRPRGIAVDPIAGYIFWTDIQTLSIGRSSLTGEEAKNNLIYGRLSLPSGLVLDTVEEKIYWTDRKAIFSAKYDGTMRQIFYRYSYAFFYDISLFQDVIVATDIERYYAFFINKTSGKEVAERLQSPSETFYGSCTYKHKKQPPTGEKEACLDYGCQDICVKEPGKQQPTCLCRDGYLLNGDLKTCSAFDQPAVALIFSMEIPLEWVKQVDTALVLCVVYESSLLPDTKCVFTHRVTVNPATPLLWCFGAYYRKSAFGYPYHRGVVINTGDKLCIVSIQILSNHEGANPTCFYTAPENSSISWFDLNMKLREVYFSIDKSIYSVPIDTVTQEARLLTQQNYEIRGLTYDWMEELIFYALTTDFSTKQPESIWRIDPNTRFTIVSQMITGESPRAIAVAPHERKVFWVTGGGGNHTIEYTDLTLPVTAKIKTITPGYSLNNVSHMYHDVKAEALWVLETDFGFDYVTRIEYDGSFSRYVSVRDGLKDFALYKDYILIGYKEDGNDFISLETKDVSAAGAQIISNGQLEGIENVVGIKVFDLDVLQPTYPDPCGNTKKKGECDQICLAEGDTSTCQCNLGYLLVNDKDCKSYPVNNDFMLIADITYNEILQVPLDDPTNIIAIKTPSLGRPNGVMYNYEKKILTWSSDDYRQIWGMYLNGTGDFLITSLGFKSPDRLTFDPSSQLTFYSASSYYSIAGYSGFIGVLDSEGRELTLHSLADSPRAIVLHPQKGLLFYTDHGDPAGVFRMNMDGSNHTAIISEDVGWPNGLTIDFQAEHLYWTDGYLNKIFACNFDGGQRITILEDPNAHLMALKFLDGYLYYSAWNKGKITKVNITDVTDVTLIGPDHSLGRIHAMDIYVAGKTDNIPVHPECSINNGGCSHFCLPTPEGHSCGCETGYSLLNDMKTCENVPRCPMFLPTAIVTDSDSCLRLGGDVCEFTCDNTYKPKTGVTSLTCTSEVDPDFPEELIWNIDDPCEEIFCPLEVPNVKFNDDCKRRVDADCVMNYTCNMGYEKNMEVMEVICGGDGNWIIDKMLCIAKCPSLTSVINHGVLHPDCQRDIGSSCKFFCDDGYRSSVSYGRLLCETDSQWNVSIDSLCQEIKCLDYITGGVINETCNRKIGSICEYTCDFRFQANPEISSVTCGGDGKWNHGGLESDLLCTEISITVTSKPDNTVAIGVGVSVGFLVLVIIVVLILYMYRSGRLPLQKKPSPTTTSFENPRYTGDTASTQPTETNVVYSPLDADKVELTTDSSRKEHAQIKQAQEHVYNDLAHHNR